MANSGDKGPIDKIEEVGEKVADTLEPDDQSYAATGGGAGDASDPFAGGGRPDEERASDEAAGGHE